jgi:hypothetical protein
MTTKTSRLARTGCCAIIAAVLMGVGSAGAAPAAEPAAPLAVLYDQTNHGVNEYVTSSKFSSTFAVWDQQAADDFQVPSAKIWAITRVVAYGQYDGAPSDNYAVSVLVQFYANAANNVPGALMRQETITPGSQFTGHDTGVFSVTLGSPLSLGPGVYWVSIQAAMTTSNSRQWGWHERTQQSLNESTWRQPSDFQSTGCNVFKPRISVCDRPTGSTNPDLIFKLEGNALDIVSQTRLPFIAR